jgi:hypothetical protein
MTRFGVPDDDMPDNLPPSGWGPASSDERDLDAVLAGQMADIPIALRPVADVLAALRASPAPAELWGEANVMAEFRAHGPGGVARPMGPAPTRPLSALPDGPAPRRRPTRRRGRRKTARPVVSHWAGALTGIAAAVAIVIVVAFTGNLPANLERLAHLGPTTASPSATRATTHAATPKARTTHPAEQPTSSSPATYSTGSAQSEDTAACRAYYSDYLHPQSLVTEKSAWQQLTTLAGSPSPRQVYRFCFPYLDGMFPRWMPEFGQYPAAPHTSTGNQGSNQQASQTNPPAQNNSGGPDNSGGQNGQGAQSDSRPASGPVQPSPSTNSVSP